MNYTDFLSRKVVIAPVSGFDVLPDAINPALKPHQRDAVIWALAGGRRWSGRICRRCAEDCKPR